MERMLRFPPILNFTMFPIIDRLFFRHFKASKETLRFHLFCCRHETIHYLTLRRKNMPLQTFFISDFKASLIYWGSDFIRCLLSVLGQTRGDWSSVNITGQALPVPLMSCCSSTSLWRGDEDLTWNQYCSLSVRSIQRQNRKKQTLHWETWREK